MDGQTGAGRSKYAAKVAARKRVEEISDVDPDVPTAVETAEGLQLRDGFADMGVLPEVCAKNVREAVEKAQAACRVAKEMARRASNGLQRQEPQAVAAVLDGVVAKLRFTACRAERIR